MIPARLRFMLDRRLTVADLLDKAVRYRGDIPIFRTDEPLPQYRLDSGNVTLFAFRDTVNRLSNMLTAIGIARFDRVAIWKSNSLDYFLFSYAVMRMGAIAVPINGGMPIVGMAHFVGKVGARLLVTDKAGLGRLAASDVGFDETLGTILITDAPTETMAPDNALPDRVANVPVIALEPHFARANSNFTPPPMADDQDVLICHTSGTTGFPKGVLHSSRSLALASQGQVRMQPLTRRNLAMSAGWMNHHIMLTGCLAALVAGLPLLVATNMAPDHLLRLIARHRVNIFFSFPDIYLKMHRAGLKHYDLSSMRMWMSGGDAMHEVHIRAFCAQGAFLRIAGLRLASSAFCELLGTSEVGMVALMKTSFAGTKRYGRCVGRRTMFSPQVKVAGPDGQKLGAGEVGWLMVRGPTVFKGYWNDHARSHGVVIDGWWWTGDLAYQDRRGRFYQVDRDTDAVRTTTGPVYSLPVEEEALKYPGVHEAVLFAAPGENGHDVPMLLVQVAAGHSDLDLQSIRRFVAERVPLAHPIEKVVSVSSDEDVPRGLTGKVLKRLIRHNFSENNISA